jgi:nucleoside-diphosphate-sugar epimerase
VSSTSVYDKVEQEYFEDTEILKSTNELVFKAEQLISKRTALIFRASGLMGYNRIPGKHWAGRNVNFPDASCNYVHQDDVISAVIFCLENQLHGIYNLCSKMHPSKMDIFLCNAKKYNFEDPIFGYKKTKIKRIINSDKLRKLGFKYKYENPFLYK